MELTMEEYHSLDVGNITTPNTQKHQKDNGFVIPSSLKTIDGRYIRSSKYADEIHAYILDIDENPPPLEVLEDRVAFLEYNAQIETTTSSTPDNPRYRITFEASPGTPHQYYRQIVQQIASEIGVIPDPKCLDPTHSMYFVRLPSDAPTIFVELYNGRPVKLSDFNILEPTKKKTKRIPYTGYPNEELPKILDRISPTYKHDYATGKITDEVLGGAEYQGYLGAIKGAHGDGDEVLSIVQDWSATADPNVLCLSGNPVYQGPDDVAKRFSRANPNPAEPEPKR